MWGMLQAPMMGGGAQFGVNSALSVTGDRFDGFAADGFVEMRQLGLDFSLNASPSGRVSGETEFSGTLPFAAGPFGRLTVSHRVSAPNLCARALAHATTLSAPVDTLHGAGVARLRVSRGAGGQQDAVSVELARRGSGGGGGGSGKHGFGAGRGDTTSGAGAENAGSESDEEQAAAPGAAERPGARMPQLRLEARPHAGDVALRWRQAWSGALHTTAAFRSAAGQLSLDVRSRPQRWVQAGGSMVLQAGAPGGPPAVHRAAAKLTCRLPGPALRGHSVHWESSFGAPAGAAHTFKFRRRGGGERGPKTNVALKLGKRQASLEFEFDMAV
jgi:hypothetical protein